MLEETFADGNSLIHRLDPRVKITGALGFSVLTAVAYHFSALILALVLAAALVAIAKLRLRPVAYRLAAVNGFLLFLWLTLPLSYPGDPVFHIGPLGVSGEGILSALLITIKSNAIILAVIALLSTTHITETGRALGRLHVPDKIIHILLFMLRYLNVINREYVWLTTAMKMRCFRPRTNLHTYRSYANMVGMLLISSYESAEAIYAAMLCRGFKGKFYATDDFSIKRADVAFGAVLTVSLVIIGLLEWGHLPS